MNERMQATIEAIEASNPTPVADAATDVDQSKTATPAEEQGNDAATDAEPQQGEVLEDSGDSAASDGNGAPAQRQNKGVGKRINELTREKYEAIRRAEAAERRAQELENQRQGGQSNSTTTQTEGKPKLADFNFDQEAYLDALADWRVSQKLSERDTESQARQKQAQEQERQQQFQERLVKFDSENPGKWEAATKAPINFTEAMLEVVATSDVGPQIAVYLSENLDRADEISRMSPYAAAAALGRIEVSLSAPKPNTPPAPPKTVSKAPPPVPNLSGASAVRKDLASMDVTDHLEAVRAKRNR